MEEMLYVGYQYGQFQTDEGKTQPYCNCFFVTGFAGEESADYHFGGQKAVKKKCVKPDVWSGIAPNTNDYVASLKDKAGAFPAFLTAAIACVPDDLMLVFWMSIVCVVVVAVWKKWFS